MVWHRRLPWACAPSAMLVGLAVSIAPAQDPFQVAEKSAAESTAKADKTSSTKKPQSEFVRKTDEEWQRILSPAEYMVTRLKVTEPAFTGKYATGHYRGTFTCVCCGAALFDARH